MTHEHKDSAERPRKPTSAAEPAPCDIASEQWVTIPGTDGYYSVSSMGRIVSRHNKRGTGDVYITQKVNRWGYVYVDFYAHDKRWRRQVSHVVMESFGLARPHGFTANHKDGNKLNNAIGNLEWLTQADNNRHAIEILGVDRRGENSPRSRLSEDAVLSILREPRSVTSWKLSPKYGVSDRAIDHIRNGTTWKNVPRIEEARKCLAK